MSWLNSFKTWLFWCRGKMRKKATGFKIDNEALRRALSDDLSKRDTVQEASKKALRAYEKLARRRR